MPENRDLTTKEKILKHSTALFCDLGYSKTSVRAIARAVGIRESALYNHFANKEAIFIEATKDIFSSPFPTKDEDIKELALKGKVYLHKIATEYKLLTFDKKSENMFRLLLIELFSNDAIRDEFIKVLHEQNIKRLSEAFFIMMQNSLIRSADPMLVAYEFLAGLFYIRFHVAILRFDSKSTSTLSTQFEKHVEFFWDGIKL
ncbi:MAG: TetR/AcrR family transcriptional regulator [Sulfurimonas sp.]|jgi:AcrR family transcriptional regulator|nr:TetR/AcrR family transcriptional regulator [Sulfurimonadaceae bacterium]